MTTKIAVCASGEGTNFSALVNATISGLIEAQVVGLLTNRARAPAVQRAAAAGVPYKVLAPSTSAGRDAWDHAMVGQLREWGAEWVVLAGYLVLIGPHLLKAYPGRIVNCHPSLLPKFGGPGMYGEHVHRAVLASGAVETGVTVHLIDGAFDRGEIVAQQKVPVLANDTAASLASRVKAAEVKFYPQVLSALIAGQKTMS